MVKNMTILLALCRGLTPAGSSAPRSCLLAPPGWDRGGNQRGNSEKTHGLT